jgi:NAD(P)-dependent dehydrogenase (short-subunit alcohol dehydrogenase family)
MTTPDRKVVIVTGGSQGIGAGIVEGYRSKGWAVVPVSLSVEAATDPETLPVAGDISDPATAARVVDAALDRFGRIDTLVNNAGLYISKPFVEYSAADYASMVGVNLTGFFHLTQLAIAHMLSRGSGHVVSITTTLVDVTDAQTPTVLTALTKGGLAAATRSLAVEHAARGVRVNAVSPGIIQTPVHPAETYADLGSQLPPMGHVGQVRDVVEAVLFLESSPFVTGEIVHVDGGQIAGH